MSWGNGKRGRRVVDCLRCKSPKFHEARGLCKPCYNTVTAQGRLDAYPPLGGYGHAALRGRVTRDAGVIPMREVRRDAA